MNIEQDIEEILKKKGIAPPGMTEEQFVEKFYNRLVEMIPLMLEKTAIKIIDEIMDEEMKRIGRDEPCRFWRRGRGCISPEKPPNCRDCTSYKPRSRWRRLVRLPEFWEAAVIGAALASFVAVMFAGEISIFVLCFWFGLVVISRLHNYWIYRQLRKLKAI